MRRNALILVLGLGAVAGFGSSLLGCHYHAAPRRQAFEDHIADVCTRAAARSRDHAAHAENIP